MGLIVGEDNKGGGRAGEKGEEEEEEEDEKIPKCVKAKVIDPFGAAALLPTSTSVITYLSRARVLLTI